TQNDLLVKYNSRQELLKILTSKIYNENPGLDTSSIEFHTLQKVLIVQLINNKGEMVADDYNFVTAHYNVARELAKTIEILPFPQLEKTELRKQYCEQIIAKGLMPDLNKEKVKLKRAIPDSSLKK
ncbi:MAG: hypothetical protein HC830_05445, partial [Bacteroidetes bacterium]|nr:hypothetical protein [Bacteroidota bacterium]